MAYKDPEEGRARDRERFRRRTAERIAQGLCPNCGKKPPEPERRLCAPCAGKRREAERVRDATRRAAGKPRHGNPETERARERRRAAERIAQGLCANCGKEPPAPDRTLCRCCAGKRREAERARYAKAKAAGKLYGGRDPKERRRNARGTARRLYEARREAGLCTRCGLRPPVEGGTACEPCREARRAGERRQWAARRMDGLCGTCGEATFDGASRCGRCAAIEAGRSPRKNAASRKRYARRRARGLCTDCGQPSQGAARCEPCARQSHERSDHFRGIPLWPARYTVIEIATGEDHGTFESLAEVAACLAFARLSFDQVEVFGDVSPIAAFTAYE